jgi:hypothetical protein
VLLYKNMDEHGRSGRWRDLQLNFHHFLKAESFALLKLQSSLCLLDEMQLSRTVSLPTGCGATCNVLITPFQIRIKRPQI